MHRVLGLLKELFEFRSGLIARDLTYLLNSAGQAGPVGSRW